MNKIKVILNRNSNLIFECIDNDLSAMQKIVNGYLEEIRFPNGIIMMVNEEGNLLNLKKTAIIHAENGDFNIVGDFFFIRAKGEEFTSIKESDMEIIKEYVSLI